MDFDKKIEEAYERMVKVAEKILGTEKEDVQGGVWGETIQWEGNELRLTITLEVVE